MMHLDTLSPVRRADHTNGSSSSRTLVPVTACLSLLLVPYFLLPLSIGKIPHTYAAIWFNDA